MERPQTGHPTSYLLEHSSISNKFSVNEEILGIEGVRGTNKKVLMAVLLASVWVSILPTFSTAQENSTAIKVEPDTIIMGPEPAVGQEFSVNITLYDVADLYGWELKLFWDNSLLNCTAEEYPILPASLNWESPNSLLLGPGIQQDYNTTNGRWYHGLSALPMAPPFPEPFTGTIKLATLTFKVLTQPPLNGSCTLDLVDSKISDSNAISIDHETSDGFYEILSPPTPPTPTPGEWRVKLNSPIDNHEATTSHNIAFGSTANFTSAIINSTVYIWHADNGTLFKTAGNQSEIENLMQNDIEVYGIPNGTYEWNVGYHNGTNEVLAITNFKLIVNVSEMPPSEPRLEIEPETYTAIYGERFEVNVDLSNVDLAAMLVGVEFKLRYNTTMLGVLNVAEGPFIKDLTWAFNGTQVAGPFIEEDYVVWGVILLPHVNGGWTAYPEGAGRLAIISFEAIAEGSCALELFDTKLSNSLANPISHQTEDGNVAVTKVTSDVNGDGVVDINDIILAGQSLGSYSGHPRWNLSADVNSDGVVDIFDLALIAGNFGYAPVKDLTPPTIESIFQQPVNDNVHPDDKVKVNVTVSDNLSGVKQVILNCTYTNSSGTWTIVVDMISLQGRHLWNATLPTFPYCTSVSYTVIAEDNAGNTITSKDMGYENQYHVIPEFSSFLVLPLLMGVTLLATIHRRRKHSA